MRKFLLAVGLCLLARAPVAAQANQNYVTISSATYCGVSISTSVATQVDNFNATSGCTGTLTGRTEVMVCNPKAAAKPVNCAYNNSVSTQTATGGSMGAEIQPGTCINPALGVLAKFWCMSQDTAAQIVHVSQAKPLQQPGDL